MASSKYGRLFTEADMQQIVNVARLEGAPVTVAELVADWDRNGGLRPMTFPADMPLFLLTATDRAALETVAFYRREARRFNLDIKHDEAVLAAFDAMRAWQAAHPAQVTEP